MCLTVLRTDFVLLLSKPPVNAGPKGGTIPALLARQATKQLKKRKADGPIKLGKKAKKKAKKEKKEKKKAKKKEKKDKKNKRKRSSSDSEDDFAKVGGSVRCPLCFLPLCALTFGGSARCVCRCVFVAFVVQ